MIGHTTAIIGAAEVLLHLLGAIVCTSVVSWMMTRREARSAERDAIIVALSVTAVWCIVLAATGAGSRPAIFAETGRDIAWLFVLYRLFASDGRHHSLLPIQPLMIALVFVELLQFVLLAIDSTLVLTAHLAQTVFHLSAMFRVMVAVGVLVLLHNLYLGAAPTVRVRLRWITASLGAIWVFDLNFYTVAYLGDGLPDGLAALRGLTAAMIAVPMAIGTSRAGGDLKFGPSRIVAFQSLLLLVIGAYLLFMVIVAQSLALIGGNAARLAQVGFVFVTSMVALLRLPSPQLRGWLKVTVIKHLFQHRYDYRAEWLRFTQTIGRGGDSAMPLHERAVQALADVTDSPGGLLLSSDERGGLEMAAVWQWTEMTVPPIPISSSVAAMIERDRMIIDLDDVRSSSTTAAPFPNWLIDSQSAWALVPLMHYNRLVGVIVLARPLSYRKLDWEDFDLLRVVGQQLASFLAERNGQEALGEATRFEEFHRRIAFVMHDIKNLASQMSLLARNAEKHADNPDFRADMLVTLRNSADKLNNLLARLGRYGSGAAERVEPVSLEQLATQVSARFAGGHPVVITESTPCEVLANPENLDQALVHLVQNAVDASPAESTVFLRVIRDQLNGMIEILDAGPGMSADFIRTRLFKPFVSSKSGGFGIGAFEARELIRAMNGRLDVESREGLGTRFFVRLPLSATPSLSGDPMALIAKVA